MPRLMNAFMVWLQGRFSNQEDGETKWREFVAAVHEAPARRDAPAARRVPSNVVDLPIAPRAGLDAFGRFLAAHEQTR